MGVPLKVIQEILGHNSYAITADIYTDVLPSMQKEAMDQWDGVFNPTVVDEEQRDEKESKDATEGSP
jgi:hypothetical protein